MKAHQLTDDPIIIEQHLNAPVKKVWGALTENEQMKKWYFELKEFKPSVGFKFHFMGGKPDGKQYCTYVKSQKSFLIKNWPTAGVMKDMRVFLM